MGDHPMTWCHEVDDGHAWYTAFGHEGYLYRTPDYREHLLGGILTAAGQVDADCTEDLRCVMDHAGIERAHLFGSSEGGPMTLLFAATYPDRVDSLILFGTGAYLHPTRPHRG
jgi:pimeloyl-ACP methyl ester carboxylesterase